MADIFLIDGNGIGFACHMGTKLTVGGQQTQAVFGIARTLRAMQTAYPKAQKVMLWDGRAHWRIEMYPEYKANREANRAMVEMREAYKSQRPYIEKLVNAMGIDQVRSPNCEADDIAAAFAQAFSLKGKTVRLISADKDWLQLINEKVSWQDPIRDKLINHVNFSELSGFKRPSQILDHKCLVGDTSDNIKGVGGIGDVGAKKLLAAYGSVDHFLSLADSGRLEGIPAPWEKLAKNEDGRRDRYIRNKILMDLLGPAKPGVADRVVNKGRLSPEDVQSIAEELAFVSIASDVESWLKPFQEI